MHPRARQTIRKLALRGVFLVGGLSLFAHAGAFDQRFGPFGCSMGDGWLGLSIFHEEQRVTGSHHHVYQLCLYAGFTGSLDSGPYVYWGDTDSGRPRFIYSSVHAAGRAIAWPGIWCFLIWYLAGKIHETDGCCRHCGYDLRGATCGTCSECGQRCGS